MKKYEIPMIFVTDRIIDNKCYGVERLDAEGNSREVAYSIRDALSSICESVEMFEDIDQLTCQLPRLNGHVILSTRYGPASPNSKALVPALCESHGIKYVGADSYTHMLCNDKYLSKKYIEEFGLRSAPAVLIRDCNDIAQLNTIGLLKFPVVIKPNYGGGSNGITNGSVQHSLQGAINYVKRLQQYQNQPILVEEYIPGYEVEIIIFGNQKRILFLDEIQLLINGEDYFSDVIYDLQTKKIDADASDLRYSSFLNNTDKEAMIKLFQSFKKAEIMRIDCRICDGHAYVIELSPDCYLGKDGGVHLAFLHHGYNFPEMFSLMLQNALHPEDLTVL